MVGRGFVADQLNSYTQKFSDMKTFGKSLLAILLLLPGWQMTTFSQNIEVASSNPDFINSTAKVHKIIGHDPDHFYVIKFFAGQYYLQKLDRNLNPMTEKPIKLFEGIKTYELENVVHFGNELYVFFSRARLNDITLYYQKIDKGSMAPSTEITEVTTVRNIKGSWADFHITLSRQETRLLIACITKLNWSKDQFNEFYVYGEGLNLLWKMKDSFQFQGLGPRDNTYLVDEFGNVSILSVLRNENFLSLIRKRQRNLYSIYRYTHDGQTYNEYPVTLGNNYIRGIRIVAGEQGELICAGLYSELFNSGVKGTFFYKIDAETGRIYDNSLNPYDQALMSQLAAMKEPMRNDEELVYYFITDMVLRENGRIMMIAEQVFDQTYDTYNNLIVTSFENNGLVYWNRLIEKNQDYNFLHSTERIELSDDRDYIMATGFINQGLQNFCSYALMAPLGRSGIILFYNDDIRNRDGGQERKNFNRPKKSYILAVAIDEYGNLTRKPLTEWKKKALFPEPIRFYDNLHETIVIPAFRGRKYNYYKITATF
jgi:hypothetical protein